MIDTNVSMEEAGRAFGEAARAWREEVLCAPDLFLNVTARIPTESIVVLPGGHNGYKTGRVERRIVVRVGSEDGEPLMDVTASTITHGVWTIIGMIRECTARGTAGSRARHEWEMAYYQRLRVPPVMCAGCRTEGTRAGRDDAPDGWTRADDDPDELWCPTCTNGPTG